MVSADLEGLVAAHHEAGLLVLLVLEQADVTGTTLLPLLAVTVEFEKLGTHLEGLLLQLLVGLGLHLLGQADDRLEVNIRGLGGLVLIIVMTWLATSSQYNWAVVILCRSQQNADKESGVRGKRGHRWRGKRGNG